MFDPDAPGSTFMPSFEAAARSLKVVPVISPVHNDVEIETAMVALGREPGGGLVAADAFTSNSAIFIASPNTRSIREARLR
jgi:putative ABC transport system substrate-binding protein